jgi:hypothetical protein
MMGLTFERVKKAIAAVWRVLVAASVIIALVPVAALIWSQWHWLRGEVLTAEVQVWHLFLAVGLEAAGAAVFVVWWTRRVSPKANASRQRVRFPREIDDLGVKWPVLAVESLNSRTITHFEVGRPMCPKCRTPLALVVTVVTLDDEREEHTVLPLEEKQANVLAANQMVFECSNDGSRYDLRASRCGMRDAKEFVNDLAMGRYRNALAAARGSDS